MVGMVKVSGGFAFPLQIDPIFSHDQRLLKQLDSLGVKPENVLVCQGHGDSLIGDGIPTSTFLFLDRAAPIIDGRIYAVKVHTIDNKWGVTIKHYYKEGGKVRLAASNPRFEDMVYKMEDVEVIGGLVYWLQSSI